MNCLPMGITFCRFSLVCITFYVSYALACGTWTSRTSRGNCFRSSNGSFNSSSRISHRLSVIESLNSLLITKKENFVPTVLAQKIFSQFFSYINVQLFNSLLLRRECCSFSNWEYVKAGLAELELWCGHAQEEVISSMEIQTTEESNEAGVKSFLLDDNSSIPFSVDDISTCLQDSNFRGVKPAAELLGNPAFEFLQ